MYWQSPYTKTKSIRKLEKLLRNGNYEERKTAEDKLTKAIPFHHAASYGCLKSIPVELLTEANLLKTDSNSWTKNAGQTVLHVAAWYGHLDQVPREVLTEENLLKTVSNLHSIDAGQSVIHVAASYKHLDQIPEE